MPKVSIIVPVYNAGSRIRACLRSIQAQTLTNFEVICVNDGSTDNSAACLEQICSTDKRFTCINQPVNAGVSAARNKGLEIAQGEYIMFVDADDTLPEKALSYLQQIAEQYEADTICGMYERIDGVTAYVNERSKHLAANTQQITPDNRDLVHTWGLWNKWFFRKIIEAQHIRFEAFSHLEDAVFLYTYLQYAKAIYTCPHVVYTYRKPLSFAGRTTTQQADESLVGNAHRAFERICELTKGYGAEFLNELRYRYINTPLLGDYYRRIWMLSDKTANQVIQEVDALLALLDKEHQEKLLQNNFDVIERKYSANHAFSKHLQAYSKKNLCARPLITVIIGPHVDNALVLPLLEELYDQASVSFCVQVSRAFKKTVPTFYASMPNFAFIDNAATNQALDIATRLDAPSFSALERCCTYVQSSYVALINHNIIYDHRSLFALLKALHTEDILDYTALSPRALVSKTTDFFALPTNYKKAKRSLLSCCLFKTASLQNKSFNDLVGKQVGKPSMIVASNPSKFAQKNFSQAKLIGFGISAVDTQKGTQKSPIFSLLNKCLHKFRK